MILGIACFGLITATVTTFIMQRTEEGHAVTTTDLMATLKDLQARMSRLEEQLARKQGPP